MRARWVLPVGAIVTVLATIPGRSAEADCSSSSGAVVVVETKKHTLTLCKSGRVVQSFGVRLGKHGTGKSREGDGKTPLGRYPLGGAVPSADYGLFLPIGYPTPEQRKLGYTGSAVGVHGPARRVRWLGSWVNAFDLTDGCVGIATDDEMKVVAEFVGKQGAHEIMIR
jgi:murein L,D-transpeptidase YafK